MKRSRINEIMRAADDFVRAFGFTLPPFAYWTPDEFRRFRNQASGVIAARLGWDITDFAENDFDHFGLVLFTLRNGDPEALGRGRGMLYAEKLLICRPGQMNPMHRHNIKAEDIINRGGGRAVFELFMSDADGAIDCESDVVVHTDGMERRLPPGGLLRLAPGESVTLLPGVWHRFWAEDADVLFGEVSTVNDDLTDNVFTKPLGRFAEVEEDEPPLHLLVSDYETYLRD